MKRHSPAPSVGLSDVGSALQTVTGLQMASAVQRRAYLRHRRLGGAPVAIALNSQDVVTFEKNWFAAQQGKAA
jgi:hypothetical protein